jgi:uncharacterized protein
MNHGLSNETVMQMRTVFSHFPAVEQVILYGSRAKGDYRQGSDIDLTLIGEVLNERMLDRIENELDDLLLPYRCDLSLYSHLTHAELLDHIRRVGQVFYDRKGAAVPLKPQTA